MMRAARVAYTVVRRIVVRVVLRTGVWNARSPVHKPTTAVA